VKASAKIASHYAERIEKSGTQAGSDESKEVVKALKEVQSENAVQQQQIGELTQLYLKSQEDWRKAVLAESEALKKEGVALAEAGAAKESQGRAWGIAFAAMGGCVICLVIGAIGGKIVLGMCGKLALFIVLASISLTNGPPENWMWDFSVGRSYFIVSKPSSFSLNQDTHV
jgi:hypothetical protein